MKSNSKRKEYPTSVKGISPEALGKLVAGLDLRSMRIFSDAFAEGLEKDAKKAQLDPEKHGIVNALVAAAGTQKMVSTWIDFATQRKP